MAALWRPHYIVVTPQASVPALEANLAIPFNKAALPGVTMTVGSPRGVPPGAQQVGQEGLIALIQSLFWSREAAQTCALGTPAEVRLTRSAPSAEHSACHGISRAVHSSYLVLHSMQPRITFGLQTAVRRSCATCSPAVESMLIANQSRLTQMGC